MLIICTGPETYLARQKIKELVYAYKQKHDPTGRSIEYLENQSSVPDAINRLGNLDLFASKKLLKYENLLSGITPAQAKKLNHAIINDDDQNIILTYEDKSPTAKILELFIKEKTFIYKFEKLKGSELNKWVSNICKINNVNTDFVSKLIELYGDDLWSIVNNISIISLSGKIQKHNQENERENIFNIIDNIIKQKLYYKDLLNYDANEILPLLISQSCNWHKVKDYQTSGIHPYVQKKLATTNFVNSEIKTRYYIKSLFSIRNSIAQSNEFLQTF